MVKKKMTLKIKDVANIGIERCEIGKDAVIAITGYEGDGKSSLAAQVGEEGGKKSGTGFDYEINELYSPNKDEMRNKVLKLPALSTVVADEAINLLYKLNWSSDVQKYINKLYALCRKENKMTLLCMPRFIDFNEFFRNHRILLWVHIIQGISKVDKTGMAAVFDKDWSPFSKDPWWIKETQKRIDINRKKKRRIEVDVEEKMEILEKSSNFIGPLTFGRLPPDRWNLYESLRDKEKYKYLDEDDNPLQKVSKRTREHMEQIQALTQKLIELGMTQQDIATILNRTQQNVSILTKRTITPLIKV